MAPSMEEFPAKIWFGVRAALADDELSPADVVLVAPPGPVLAAPAGVAPLLCAPPLVSAEPAEPPSVPVAAPLLVALPAGPPKKTPTGRPWRPPLRGTPRNRP